MGALKAFGDAVNFTLRNPRLALIPLLIALILAPMSAYIQRDIEPFSPMERGKEIEGIIIEEHGATGEMGLENLWPLLFLLLLSLLLNSAAQYSVIYGALRAGEGKDVPLSELFVKGLEHIVQVFGINVLTTIIVAAAAIAAGLPFLMLVIGGAFVNSNSLMLAGVILLLIVEVIILPFLVGASSMTVPAYVVKGSFGSFIDGFAVAWKNKLSSMGFGALLLIFIMAIVIAPAAIVAIILLASQGLTARIVAALIQAPFQAVAQTFASVAGLFLYLELKEELERADNL
ncbi:hypothetical protein PYCH_04400 [Pyrococcus yayanosii CH1]|uniref:Uncharacterized protein n=2 Tax=Pyrococcus TaxID=2260 RepID=F8AHD3_PYRYC|nr:hypothetical protein PYCH_04400 [Pyrococcus yayanosii CH1]